MTHRSRALGYTVAVAILGLVVSPARALDLSEWVPGLRLFPFLSERIEYESNVFQVPTGGQGSTIFKTIPGFLLEYGSAAQTFSAGYRAEILNYVALPNQNTVNNVGTINYQADLPRTRLVFRNDFIQTVQPPNTEITGPVKTLTNTLAPTAEYRLTDRLSVGVSYTWTHISYPDQQFSELNENSQLFGVAAFWKIRPTLDLWVGYQSGFQTFFNDSERDTTNHYGKIGLRGDITPKLSSSFWVGVEAQIGDTSSVNDFLGFVMGGDLT